MPWTGSRLSCSTDKMHRSVGESPAMTFARVSFLACFIQTSGRPSITWQFVNSWFFVTATADPWAMSAPRCRSLVVRAATTTHTDWEMSLKSSVRSLGLLRVEGCLLKRSGAYLGKLVTRGVGGGSLLTGPGVLGRSRVRGDSVGLEERSDGSF